MGFSEIQLLKKLGEQFNIVIDSIWLYVSLFDCIWYSWRFQESAVDLCNFIMCIFKPCFRLEFNDETCLNVESSRILEKGTLECRNVGS